MLRSTTQAARGFPTALTRPSDLTSKTIRNLAIAALFVFPGLSGFPQEVQQDETPAAKPVVEENVNFFFAPMGFP